MKLFRLFLMALGLILPMLVFNLGLRGLPLHKAEVYEVLLHQVSSQGNQKAIHKIVMQGVPVDSPLNGMWTPLMEAASKGHLAAVKVLTKLEANVDAVSDYGETPLLLAMLGEHDKVVAHLVDMGAGFEVKGQKVSPLSFAVRVGDINLVKLFLKSGANPNGDGKGEPPLHLAISGGHSEIAKILIRHFAKVNTVGTSSLMPLSLAILYNDLLVLQELLFFGADIDRKGYKKLSAYQLASALNKKEAIDLMKRTLKEVKPSYRWASLLPQFRSEDLAAAILQKNYEHIKLILNSRVNLKKRFKNGWTPLMLAITTGEWRIFELVFKFDRNVNAKTRKGFTPLHLAVVRGWPYVIEQLLKAGANVSALSKKGVTPFDFARISTNGKTVTVMKPKVIRKSVADRHFVKELQSLLYLRGYNTGTPDGVRGKKTDAAVLRYNWATTGSPNYSATTKTIDSLWKNMNKAGAVGELSGGFAISDSAVKMTWNFLTEGSGKAKKRAIKNCRKAGRGPCSKWSVGFSQGCFAYAKNAAGGWAYQVSETIWKARNKALKRCHNHKKGTCRVTVEFCSDGSFTYKQGAR